MTDSAPPEQSVPAQLGEFRIEAVLGEGGSGTVYAAHWGHREVALKVLRDAWLPSDGERKRFLDEARLLADVNHPGVVRILGFGELPDGRPYLAMERLEGESLAARLHRGALSVERSLVLFEQLCQAVGTLHERGLIHRDIKPENVFLVRDERYAVLLDFGIAKPVNAPDSTVTREGGIRGTPAYMAPERFFGSAANISTDIYELGVVLFAMLAGRLPWDGANDPVTRLNPRRPSELGITLPGALEETLLDALASRAECRPASVTDLGARVARSLHEALSNAGVRRTADLPTADATNPTPIASYWSDSSPNIVIAELPETGLGAATTLGVGLPTPAGTTPGTPAGTTPGTPAGTTPVVTPPRRGHLAVLMAGGLVAVILLVVGAYLLTRPAQEQPLSVDATGLVRPLDPPARAAAVVPRRPIPAGPDSLVWRMHPADSHLLLRLSYDALRQSEVYKAMTDIGSPLAKIPQVRVVNKACQMDLHEQVEWLSIGLSGDANNTLVDFMLHGRWTRDAVESCIASLGKAAGLEWSLKRQGAVTQVELGGSAFWIGWPDSQTLFLSNRDTANHRWIEERLAGRRSARDVPTLRRLYDLVEPDATAWAVIESSKIIDDELFDKLPKPETAALYLRVASDLKLQVVAHYQTAKIALQVRDRVRIKLHKLKSNAYVETLLTRAKVFGAGNNVRLTIYQDRVSALFFAKALSSFLESADLSAITPKPKQPTDAGTPSAQ